MPQLTIAIPYYGGLDYLRSAIDSVLAQRSEGWRLRVRDDHAAEPAESLVHSYHDPRIQIQRNDTNLGMVRNWNLCLDQADTDLVTLLHADDRLEPDYVDVMTALGTRHPGATAYFCDATIMDTRGKRRFSVADAVKPVLTPRGRGDLELRGEAGVKALMRGNFIMCPTLCFRKSVLGKERFAEEWRQVQDLEFTTRLLMADRKIVGSRRSAYAYRRHPASATTQQSESLLRFDEEFRLFDQVAARSEALGWHDAARVSRRKAILRLHLLYRVLRDTAALRPASARQKLRFLLSRR